MNPGSGCTPNDEDERERTGAVQRRRVLAVGASVGAAMLAGCTGGIGSEPTDGGDPGTGDGTASTGTFRLLISDQPVAIDEFDSLDVTLDRARIFRGEGDDEETATDSPTATTTTEPTATNATATATTAVTASETDEDDEDDDVDDEQAGFTVIDLDGATVDLTDVVGEKAISVFEGELEEGRYAKIELYADDVEGIVDGNAVDVMIPSGKLQIVKPFEVVAGETLSFVFDINVVKKGQTGEYNLLPVIAKSGVAGEDVEVDEIERSGDDDDEEESQTVEGTETSDD